MGWAITLETGKLAGHYLGYFMGQRGAIWTPPFIFLSFAGDAVWPDTAQVLLP